MPRQAIQEYALSLKVPYLLHFTRVENIPTIMQHGLYPVARAHEVGAVPAINDHLRLDGHRNGTSLSIAFPNSRMFYKYRKECEDTEWVVLVVRAEVLWTKSCAFCRHNAADARISGLPLADLTTFQAFAGMFEEIEGHETRQDQKLRAFDPTDLQAEVLVLDVIEPQHIVGAVFSNAEARDLHLAHFGGRTVRVHGGSKGMFASRGYVRMYQ